MSMMVKTVPEIPVKVEVRDKVALLITVDKPFGTETTIWSYSVPALGVVLEPVSSICNILLVVKIKLVVVNVPRLAPGGAVKPGAMIPVPVPVISRIVPVPMRVPPETLKSVVLVLVEIILISTTPVVTTVVALVLAPEIVVVKPPPEVMGVKLKSPEIFPGSTILPPPAFRVVLAVRVTLPVPKMI